MGTTKDSRIPVVLLYIVLFLAGGLSRTLTIHSTGALSGFIYIVLVAVWFHDVRRRVLDDSISRIVTAICAFDFYLLIARTIKYCLVFELTYLETLTWYLPCVGVIQSATLMFLLSVAIGEPDTKGFKRHHLLVIPGAVISILMVTNDIHNLAYRFLADGSYKHGILYYIYIFWVVVMFGISLVIMYRKCSVSPGRRYVWIPFAVLIGFFLVLNIITTILDNSDYWRIVRYNWYETFIAMEIVYIESCIAIGLIPSRSGFDQLFRNSSVAVEIADTTGKTVMRSSVELKESDEKNIIRKHAVIPGGYICWNDDVTDINRITESIVSSVSELTEENDLIRAEKDLNNADKEYTLKVAIYDDITRAVEPQAVKIKEILDKGDPDYSALVIYGVFIKRKANLMILSADTNELTAGELYLSLKDAMEYLKFSGIDITLKINGKDEDLSVAVPAPVIISLFDEYQRYIEANYKELDSVKVSIEPGDEPKLYIDAVRGKEEESYVLS